MLLQKTVMLDYACPSVCASFNHHFYCILKCLCFFPQEGGGFRTSLLFPCHHALLPLLWAAGGWSCCHIHNSMMTWQSKSEIEFMVLSMAWHWFGLECAVPIEIAHNASSLGVQLKKVCTNEALLCKCCSFSCCQW